jgi:hypothetical protein
MTKRQEEKIVELELVKNGLTEMNGDMEKEFNSVAKTIMRAAEDVLGAKDYGRFRKRMSDLSVGILQLPYFKESADQPAEAVYVIVAENDRPMKSRKGEDSHDPDGPIVFEQYTRKASLSNILARKEYLRGQYGTCKIAKLVFVEDERIAK